MYTRVIHLFLVQLMHHVISVYFFAAETKLYLINRSINGYIKKFSPETNKYVAFIIYS